ncbi:hypothetical protein LIER_20527 [Lithospermum erythrorhizon]|uniref:Uncharacterized protein n=1 Tax=Lithospermum erythrorhizon TaxID=34254 RepID=A0AAV3QLV1_LITER
MNSRSCAAGIVPSVDTNAIGSLVLATYCGGIGGRVEAWCPLLQSLVLVAHDHISFPERETRLVASYA